MSNGLEVQQLPDAPQAPAPAQVQTLQGEMAHNDNESPAEAMQKSFYRLRQEELEALKEKRKAAMLAGDFNHYHDLSQSFATAGLAAVATVGLGIGIGLMISIPIAPVIMAGLAAAALGFVGNIISQYAKMRSEKKANLTEAVTRRSERLQMQEGEQRSLVHYALYGDPNSKDPIKRLTLEELQEKIKEYTNGIDEARRAAADEGRSLSPEEDENIRLKEAHLSKMRIESKAREAQYEQADAAWAEIEEQQDKAIGEVESEILAQRREGLSQAVDAHSNAKEARVEKGGVLANLFTPVAAMGSAIKSAVLGVVKSVKGAPNVLKTIQSKIETYQRNLAEQRDEKQAQQKAEQGRQRRMAQVAPQPGA